MFNVSYCLVNTCVLLIDNAKYKKVPKDTANQKTLESFSQTWKLQQTTDVFLMCLWYPEEIRHLQSILYLKENSL